jgi:alpha-beta hydrolase superfamily lysophospholipase
LKSTNRYKEAKSTLEKAKKKYKPKYVAVVGHSLGGGVSQAIASPTDNVTTFNGAVLPFQKSQTNQTNYRVRGDVVSAFAIGQKHTKTINSKIPIVGGVDNFLKNHNLNRIKHEKIFV